MMGIVRAEEGGGLPMDEAARLLAHLGFEVVHGDRPGAPGGANLIIALRAGPTLQHFDPERVTYWVARAGRGRVAELDRSAELPLRTPFSWGTLRVIDRLEEQNAFLTFGGLLRAEAVAVDETIAIFSSPAPIVRWSGHSQPVDELTSHVGAFFGRLMVPIDYTPGAEARVGTVPPAVLYAAFLGDLRDRLEAAEPLATEEGSLAIWVGHELRRLETVAPGAHDQAAALLRELGLGS